MLARSDKSKTAARRWFASLLTPRAAGRPASAGLFLTPLEDRVTPATLHWTGAASKLWSAAGNWQEGRVPMDGDRLVFDTTTPGFSAANGYAPNNDLATAPVNLTLGFNDSGPSDFALTGNVINLAAVAGPRSPAWCRPARA